MSKVLQNDDGRYRETETPLRPVELILDRNFTGKARSFIDLAQSEIRLCAYAWRWYANEPEIEIQKFNVSLFKAMQRGVKIKCLVNNYSMYSYFSNLGFVCKFVDRTRMLHTKAIVIDQKTLILGSHNLTKRANSDNFEASVAIQDFETVQQFSTYFDKMWEVSNAS